MFLDVLIVEDNDLYMNGNVKYIKSLSKKYGVEVNITCFSYVGQSLEKHIKENHIDVVLLDIEIGKNSGISVGRKIVKFHPLVSIIFITAYGEYITKANKLNPVGYVDKPVEYKVLDKLFCRVVMEKIGKAAIEDKNANIITFKRNREDVEVRESEILYIKTIKRKLSVVTKGGVISTYSSLKETEKKLSDLFVKISRDIIVNKREVSGLVKGYITMSNGDIVDIPTYKYSEIISKVRS